MVTSTPRCAYALFEALNPMVSTAFRSHGWILRSGVTRMSSLPSSTARCCISGYYLVQFDDLDFNMQCTSIMFMDRDVTSKMEIHKQNVPEFGASTMSEARIQC